MAGWNGWIFSLLLITCILLQLCAAQGTCRGRCGEPFSRGKLCNCDFDCLSHGDCCKDYESICTSRGSCRGRCGEAFRRGKDCECDPDCVLYNTCCSDYHGQCESTSSSPAARGGEKSKLTAPAEIKTREKSDVKKKPKESESEERIRASIYTDSPFESSNPPTEHGHDALTYEAAPSVQESLSELMPLSEDLTAPSEAPLAPNSGIYLAVPPASHAANAPAGPGSQMLPGLGIPLADSQQPGKQLSIPIQVSLSIRGHTPGGHNKPLGGHNQPLVGPEPGAGRPSTLMDIAQALGGSSPTLLNEDQASNPDLCNGLPIDAVTSFFNGSIIVFRGHFFWLLDPRTRTVSPAQNITEQLGVPSPIDTAFTRCNCLGKTYIIKGDNYWSFENGVMEPGYPRSVSADFGGLSGEISAALSIPATRKRPESIFFFKKGGTLQKLSYPTGSGPTCSGKRMKNSVYAKIRRARQAEINLSGEININLNFKDFPTPVTSALSMPNSKKPDGFEYFIFSWPKFFSVKITGEFPSLASSAKPPANLQDIRNWLNCP